MSLRGRTRRPRRPRPASVRPNSSDGSGTPTRPACGHLEDSELVRRPEAVLHRAQDAMRVVPVALELEHAVDEVLEHARARDGAVLGHVPDEDGRDARLLRHAKQAPGAPRAPAPPSPGADPSSGAWSVCTESITQTSGRSALERGADDVEIGLRQDRDLVRPTEPAGAERDLRHGLLSRDEQRPPPGARDGAERAQQQRRLADSRLSADEDEGRRHEPAAEHAVELRDAGRRSASLPRPGRRRGAERARRGATRPRAWSAAWGRALLDERAERAAARAAAEPAAGGRAALAAAELSGGLRHVQRRSDRGGWTLSLRRTALVSRGARARRRGPCRGR